VEVAKCGGTFPLPAWGLYQDSNIHINPNITIIFTYIDILMT
jgi:hypothetical protein